MVRLQIFLIVLFYLIPLRGFSQVSSLIFSEYIEGSGSEKYLEIYNGTGSMVNLTGYSVELYTNGAATPTTIFALSGSLPNNQVLVLKNNLAVLYTGTATSSAVCNYNGDDAIVLKNGVTILDVIGKIGCDPGSRWQIGSLQTVDKTLIRKPDICTGYNGSEGICPPVDPTSFPRLYTEWYQKNEDFIADLGTHFSTCGSPAISNRYYRTVQNGDWFNVNTWESANSIAGVYTPAVFYPTHNNTDTIIIQAAHTVTINKTGFALDQTYIAGTLLLSDSADLDINEGLTGVDLMIDGTFADSTRSALGFGVLSNGTNATWKLGTNGNFIKLKNSSSAIFRDAYDGGISTIPATANWILRCADNLLLPSFVSANMYFPNLLIENISGFPWNMVAIGGTFSGTTTIIKGNLDIGGTGTSTVSMVQNASSASSNSNPIDVLGNLSIQNGSSFLNRKTGTPDLFGGGLNVKGDLLINGNLEIFNATGDIVRSALILSGNSDQNINGTGGNILATGFELNKQGASLNVFLNNVNLFVYDTLYLTRGILTTNGTIALNVRDTTILSSPASTYTNLPGNIGWESSFVRGKFSMWDDGGAANPTPFVFPVGKGTAFRPVFIRDYTCNGPFTIEYFQGNPRLVFNNILGSGLDHISTQEYWNIEAPAGSPSARVELSFDNPNSGGVTFMPDLRVAHFNGASWTDEGNTTTFGTAGSNGSVISVPQTIFSPFTLASSSALNPLPVLDIQLTLLRNNNSTSLKWSVTGDQLVKEYIIQKSADKIQVEYIHIQIALQNNTKTEYTTSLEIVPSFYRIKAILKDGTVSYSNWVGTEENPVFSIYPNPVKEILIINGMSNAVVGIYNANGTKVLEQKILTNPYKIGVQSLPSGNYLIRIFDMQSRKRITQWFIKK